MLLLEDFLKIGFILLTVGVIAASCFKVKNSAIFLYSMIFIYLVLVLGITLCPIPYGDVEHIYPAVHNFVPFRTIVSALEGGITLTAMAQICLLYTSPLSGNPSYILPTASHGFLCGPVHGKV